MKTAEPDAAGALLREGVEALRLAGSETARLDAQLLLGHALRLERTAVLAHPELRVGGEDAARYRASLERRAAGEPVAYIRGWKEFYGLALSVDQRALIPRPETERLVELARDELRRRLSQEGGRSDLPTRVVDVGTGSGAIALALAVAFRDLDGPIAIRMLGLDISADALDLARANALAHGVQDLVAFACSDLLAREAIASHDGPPFDLILANLPYVRSDAMAGLPIATSFEPALALDGGTDGLDVIERLLHQLPEHLAEGGLALLEIGADQGERIVERCARIVPGWACRVELDLAGFPRVAVVRRD